MVEFIKKNYKITILITVVVALIIFSIIFLVSKVNNDGMNNKGILKVSYKSYSKKWESWKKNGVTSGDKINPIKDLNIKIKNTKQGSIYYSVLTEVDENFKEMEGWSNQLYSYTEINKDIKAIRIGLTSSLGKRYDVCYRTYNDTNKWLNWTCNYNISGNKNKEIKAIEIKIIPKNAVKFDYLKDYNESDEIESSIGF